MYRKIAFDLSVEVIQCHFVFISFLTFAPKDLDGYLSIADDYNVLQKYINITKIGTCKNILDTIHR